MFHQRGQFHADTANIDGIRKCLQAQTRNAVFRRQQHKRAEQARLETAASMVVS